MLALLRLAQDWFYQKNEHSDWRLIPEQDIGFPAYVAGLPADGTIAAEVAFMFADWYKPNAQLQYPRGGSQAIVNALIRQVSQDD